VTYCITIQKETPFTVTSSPKALQQASLLICATKPCFPPQ
jgi:hypothetical protein